MTMKPKLKETIKKILIVLCILLVLGGWFSWVKFFREEPEPDWGKDIAGQSERFKYGSIGAEFSRGIPYWIWAVLPRIFPDLTAGPGGYKSFGLVWEEGHEMPVGFTKRVIGFPRVGNNCAICHVGTWQSKPDEVPHLVVGSPANTNNVQSVLRFLTNCAKDSRFNADMILPEIERNTKLSFVDEQIYRFILIPLTRSALLQQDKELAWMNRPHWPDWGPGRDDPMNLTKYFMTTMPIDNTTGQADFPSVWNLAIRKGPGLFLNWSCDTPAVRSVLIDSALGLGAAPDKTNPIDGLDWILERRGWFVQRMAELDDFLSVLPPPKYPFPVNEKLAVMGKSIYEQNCAACHSVGGEYTSKLVPIAQIGTDPNRMETWTQAAADEANQSVKAIGIIRPNMVKQFGYCSPPLDGLWMRAPYLHNGSVANMTDLLKPVAKRTKVFYRGYNVYDPVNLGFVAQGPQAQAQGWKVDTAERGNGNQGHTYGTTLSAADKKALVEYLKTF
jgi:hypothetical protein